MLCVFNVDSSSETASPSKLYNGVSIYATIVAVWLEMTNSGWILSNKNGILSDLNQSIFNWTPLRAKDPKYKSQADFSNSSTGEEVDRKQCWLGDCLPDNIENIFIITKQTYWVTQFE